MRSCSDEQKCSPIGDLFKSLKPPVIAVTSHFDDIRGGGGCKLVSPTYGFLH